MSCIESDRPAILGGRPIRPAGPPIWPRIDEKLQSTILKLMDSGEWGRYHGPHGPELSRRLADYHSVDYAHLCSSGTAAVELALRGLGIGSGDEVILSGYDFKSNFQNVLCVHAVPVLVDVDPSSWQLNPSRLAKAISPRTRALIVSHLHGGIVNMRQVRRIADDHGLQIVEDACQNPGAMINGRRSGTWGDVGVLSFGGSKLMTAGRGGAVITSHTEIIERLKRYCLRGNDAYPLSEMQAAILLPQLDQLDELNERRRNTVQSLCSRFTESTGLKVLQSPSDDLLPAYYKLGFQYSAVEFGGLSRDLFATSLRAEGFAWDPGFRGLHLTHASRRFRVAEELVEATRADAQMLTLHHPVLLDEASCLDEMVTAIEKIRDWAPEIIRRTRNFSQIEP